MEEFLRYLEGHKDLYQEAPAKRQLPLPSADGSRKRNLPERCPRPLHSQDSAQEEHSTPQGDGLMVVKVEDGEEEDVRGEGRGAEEEISPHISTDRGDRRGGRESFRSEEEGLMWIKVEEMSAEARGGVQEHVKAEEEEDRPVQIKEEESAMETGTGDTIVIHREFKNEAETERPRESEKQIPPEISTDEHCRRSNKQKNLLICPDDEIQNDRSKATNVHSESHSAALSSDPSEHEASCSDHSHHPAQEGDKTSQCSECGKQFTRRADFIIHLRSHTVKKIYSCSQCGKCFNERARLLVHRRSHTREGGCSCSECGACFEYRSQLIAHEKIHSENRIYLCSECGMHFNNESYLRSHQRIHTGETYTCLECGVAYTEEIYLLRHRNAGKKCVTSSESGVMSPQQSVLPKLQSDSSLYSQKSVEERCVEEEIAPECSTDPGDTSVRSVSVEDNIQVNIKEKMSLITDSTEPEDTTMMNLKAEEDIEVNIKEEETFIQIKKDEQNRRYDTEKPSDFCSEPKMEDDDITSEENVISSNLPPDLALEGISPGQSHAVTHPVCHSEAETFPCSQCGERFTERAELVLHQSCHAEEKAHICLRCGESFKERAKLLVHKISHKTSKPYSCAECKQRFSDRCSLVRHKKTHPGDVHTCPVCCLTFSKEYFLFNHLSSHSS